MLIFHKQELLQELGIVENTLRALITERGFPHPRRLGGLRVFWMVDEVVAWLQDCPKVWGAQEVACGDKGKSEAGY